MNIFPILFGVRDPIIGNGFVAEVVANGRCLMREESDGAFWVDGVNPGAVCAGGATKDEALLRFREVYRDVLVEAASRAESFEEFRSELERFFWEVTPGDPEEWHEAAERLRKDNGLCGDWLPLQRDWGEPSLKVLRREDDLEPDVNAAEHLELAANRRAA
ncbi:MAG: hypothetical protein AAF604_08110 [Acidobacteriota bacterium]